MSKHPNNHVQLGVRSELDAKGLAEIQRVELIFQLLSKVVKVIIKIWILKSDPAEIDCLQSKFRQSLNLPADYPS